MINMQFSPAGQALLKGRESRNGVPDLLAYWDKNGARASAGWAHTGPDVEVGKTYTLEQCEKWFADDTAPAIKAANAAITNPNISQNQFDAFISALYNCGPGAKGVADGLITLESGKPSTVLTLINKGDDASMAAVPEALLKWVHDAEYPPGGPGDPGLINRRNSEGGQWAKGQWVPSTGVQVAKSPTIWQQAHTKIKLAGASVAGSGVSAATLTAAGDKAQTLSTSMQFLHNYAPLIAGIGVAMTFLGIIMGIFKKDT